MPAHLLRERRADQVGGGDVGRWRGEGAATAPGRLRPLAARGGDPRHVDDVGAVSFGEPAACTGRGPAQLARHRLLVRQAESAPGGPGDRVSASARGPPRLHRCRWSGERLGDRGLMTSSRPLEAIRLSGPVGAVAEHQRGRRARSVHRGVFRGLAATRAGSWWSGWVRTRRGPRRRARSARSRRRRGRRRAGPAAARGGGLPEDGLAGEGIEP